MQWQKGLVAICFFCASLLLCSCASPDAISGGDGNYPFAGDWLGSGVDSEGNEFTFAARVTDMGDGKFRMLVLDKLSTKKRPMHVMDGVLKNNKFPYTADHGLYTGSGELSEEMFTGYYKGPIDGSFKMQRVR